MGQERSGGSALPRNQRGEALEQCSIAQMRKRIRIHWDSSTGAGRRGGGCERILSIMPDFGAQATPELAAIAAPRSFQWRGGFKPPARILGALGRSLASVGQADPMGSAGRSRWLLPIRPTPPHGTGG